MNDDGFAAAKADHFVRGGKVTLCPPGKALGAETGSEWMYRATPDGVQMFDGDGEILGCFWVSKAPTI